MIVIDGRHSGYPDEDFYDGVHLDRAGATVLSRGLARVIGDHFSSHGDGSRWIDLPAYHATADDPRLEDVEQSRVVLQSREVSRR